MVEAGDRSCYQFLLDCTDEYGEYACVQHFGKSYDRSRVLSDIDSLAAYLKIELGLKPGDVYTVFMPTTVQSIIAFYAMNKVGIIANFVHPLLPPEGLREIIRDVNSKGIMVLDLLYKKYTDVINESGLPILVCHSSDYAGFLKGSGAKLGEGLIKRAYPKIANREEYLSALNRFRRANVKPSCDCDAPAVYLNGGGTTGKSKTIKLTSRAINELVSRVSVLDRIHQPGIEAEIVVLPLFHCFGLCVAIHMAMCNAARIIPMMQFDAKLFNKLMHKNKIVGIVGIPSMFKKLMEEKHFDGKHLKDLRVLFCGGDDASQAMLDEFNSYLEKYNAPGRLRQGYGLTEVGSVCSTCSTDNYKPNSIGTALEGVEMQIWDDEHRQLPNGSIGEIAVSGPTIMTGYYAPGAAEDEGLYTDANGKKWVLSGDLGYRDDEGFFFFSGRKKRVIIISGYNVYPGDIEKKLSEFSFVKEVCCVKGFQNGKQIIRMYVSFCEKGDRSEFKKKMLACIEEHFSKFSLPREIIVVDSLPQTPLMKIDFMKLTQNNPEDEVYRPAAALAYESEDSTAEAKRQEAKASAEGPMIA